MTKASNISPAPSWHCSEFNKLGKLELYDILRLRAEVFIVEQNCAYQDLDSKDITALHLTGHIDNQLACYARLLAPGISYDDASLGRIITSKQHRGTGLGQQLLEESLRQCGKHWPESAITISAQHYLEKFYLEYGFTSESDAYMEDGIPHIRMRRPGNAGQSET